MEKERSGLSYRVLGNNIQQARLSRQLTQEQMALKLGLTQNHYGRFERGEIKPSLNRLYEICKILSVPIEDMFHGTYDPEEFEQPQSPDMTAVGIARLLGGCSERKKAMIYQLCRVIAELEREDVTDHYAGGEPLITLHAAALRNHRHHPRKASASGHRGQHHHRLP